MVPGGNAGVFVWADDITSRGVPFHRSIEVQVLENAYGNTQSHTTHGDIFPIHGAKMTPINGRGGGSRAFPTEERSKPRSRVESLQDCVQRRKHLVGCPTEKWLRRARTPVHAKATSALSLKVALFITATCESKSFLPRRLMKKISRSAIAAFARSTADSTCQAGRQARLASPLGKPKTGCSRLTEASRASRPSFRTESKFNLSGFIMDFRFTDKSNKLELLLPNASEPIVFLAQGESPFSESLEKVGSWNRIELVTTNDRSTIILNGKSHTLSFRASEGRITLMPDGAVRSRQLVCKRNR